MSLCLNLIIHLSITSSYYLSLNTFKWQQSEEFCVERCDSHLLSIHSDEEYKHLVTIIKNATNDPITSIPTKIDTWTGLNRESTSDPWTYIDNTPFTFGNLTTAGIYPWSTSFSDGTGAIKIQNYDDNYLWKSKSTSSSSLMFACNDCNEILTKYAVIDDEISRRDAEDTTTGCKSIYGTELASIHSIRDLTEAQLLCTLLNAQMTDTDDVESCYIGLEYDTDTDEYIWDDGTTFDFSSDFDTNIWVKVPDAELVEDGKTCVHLEDDKDFLLKQTGCNVDKYAICNMPSHICYADKWSTIYGVVSFDSDICEVVTDAVDTVAMISTSRWDNDGGDLVFEYMFAMNEADGTGGIVWKIDSICAKYYYIGISASESIVFLAVIEEENMVIIDSITLGFTLSKGVYYLLRGVITNGNIFTISVNDNVLLSDIDGDEEFNAVDTTMGYIGIRNTVSSITAKSLYVSGEEMTEYGNDATEWFQSCATTSTPTDDPSQSPTEYPTLDPTLPPTLRPTSNPTLYPTFDPTLKPSFDPTAHESIVATRNPTRRPSSFHSIFLTAIETSITYPMTKTTTDPAFVTKLSFETKNIWPIAILLLLFVLSCCCAMYLCRLRSRKSIENTNRAEMTTLRRLSPSDGVNTISFNAEREGVRNWLEHTVGLPQYYPLFIKTGYESVDFIADIEERLELKKIGIHILGHQTAIWAQIKQLKQNNRNNAMQQRKNKWKSGKQQKQLHELSEPLLEEEGSQHDTGNSNRFEGALQNFDAASGMLMDDIVDDMEHVTEHHNIPACFHTPGFDGE